MRAMAAEAMARQQLYGRNQYRTDVERAIVKPWLDEHPGEDWHAHEARVRLAQERRLVAHVRNVVVLKNVADVTPLLVRPTP